MALVCSICLISCGSLKPVSITRNGSLADYKYVYITPTAVKSSTEGGVYGNQYGVYGASNSKSITPSETIAGYFLKKGYVILPQLKPELEDQTVVVNFGESGKRNLNLGYTLEVTIQVISAKTSEVICQGVAEGQGSTETDDIRIAIRRYMEEMLGK